MNNSEVIMADILRREENKLQPWQEKMLKLLSIKDVKMVIASTPRSGKSYVYEMFKKVREVEKHKAIVIIDECRHVSNETWEMLDVFSKKTNEAEKQRSSLRWQDLSFTEGLGNSDGLLCESQFRLRKVLKERRI